MNEEETTILTISDVEELLGRPLTSVEQEYFPDYLLLAQLRVEDIICVSLDDLVAELGVEKLPIDLSLVLARFFGILGKVNGQEYGVSSKKVEDFTISFNTDKDIFGELINANSSTLAKYSHCGSQIRHGKVLTEEAYLYDGFRYIR